MACIIGNIKLMLQDATSISPACCHKQERWDKDLQDVSSKVFSSLLHIDESQSPRTQAASKSRRKDNVVWLPFRRYETNGGNFQPSGNFDSKKRKIGWDTTAIIAIHESSRSDEGILGQRQKCTKYGRRIGRCSATVAERRRQQKGWNSTRRFRKMFMITFTRQMTEQTESREIQHYNYG